MRQRMGLWVLRDLTYAPKPTALSSLSKWPLSGLESSY
jgi:hypothetical protein